MIRVHRVIARLNIGGPAMHVVHLTRGLPDPPFESTLIAGIVAETEGDMSYYARERGVEVVSIPEMSREVSALADLRTLLFLYRMFRRGRPTVVHTHTAKAGTLGRIAAWLARVPVLIHTFHGHVLGGGYFSPLVTRIYRGMEQALARITTRIVVLSEAQKRELSGPLRVAEAAKFRIVPLGLELDRFVLEDPISTGLSVREDLGLGPQDHVVGIVGRLVPIKNHELLFHAVARLSSVETRQVHLLVVGSGERENELRRLASDLEIQDRVHWLGWRDDLPELFAAMDVLALTSFDEGTPVAVIEALAASVPVVARAVGGVADVLDHGRFGRLVGEANPEAVAEAVMAALADGVTPEKARAMSEWARERYGVKRLCREMGELYGKEVDRLDQV